MMPTTNEFSEIAALDLEAIKAKLMHVKGGKGWSKERADAVEREYRRFLYLMKKFPNEATAPLVDVDTFWHYHILDTMKYAADCQQVFGYFLHHFPYVGMRGKEDAEALERMGERMRAVYEETFGEDYLAGLAGAARTETASSAGLNGAAAYGGQWRARQAAAPAYCSATLDEPAYCSVTVAEPQQRAAGEPAYCSVTVAEPQQRAAGEPAYCSVTVAEPQQRAAGEPAYCSVALSASAYCSVTLAEPAYCSVTVAEPAYCSVTVAGSNAATGAIFPNRNSPEHRAGFYLERPRLRAS